MINFTKLAANEFGKHLDETFSEKESGIDVNDILKKMASIAFTKFSKSNSVYFTLGHSLSTSIIGLNILDALKLQNGEVRPNESINLMAGILFCNIGIVHGILNDDKESLVKISSSEFKDISNSYTSSSIWRYKSYRGKEFIRQSPFISSNINNEIMNRSIEYSDITLASHNQSDLGATTKMVRAIQIIALMADENFSRRQAEFYNSAVEGDAFEVNMFSSLGDFRDKFSQYFWEMLYPDVGEVLLMLRESIGGKKILSKIYAHL